MTKEQGLPCRQHDPEWWFPVGNMLSASAEAAIQWCHTCPLERECLQVALDQGVGFGIWGGTTPAQRAKMDWRPGEDPANLAGLLENNAQPAASVRVG